MFRFHSQTLIDSALVKTTNSVAALGATVLLSVLALTGCASPRVDHSPASSPGPVSTPTPQATLVPNGSAQQNLPFFNQVNKQTLARNSNAQGRDFLEALVSAGFSKAAMQVTADKTTVNLSPGSIQFSINIGDYCLIGQNGSGSGGYHGEVAPALAGNVCLIGQTVPINW